MTEKFQEFSKFIVDSGLLIEHIDQLCKMRDTSTVSHFVLLVVILIVIDSHSFSGSFRVCTSSAPPICS